MRIHRRGFDFYVIMKRSPYLMKNNENRKGFCHPPSVCCFLARNGYK